MTDITTQSWADNFKPRSEPRPDLVEDNEFVQMRIAMRRQRDKEKRIFAFLAAVFVVIPILTLSVYHNVYEVHHEEVLARIFH